MTTEREELGQRTDQKLDDIVRDADEYYKYIKGRDLNETRLDVIVVSIVVWFAALTVVGISWIATFGYAKVTFNTVALFALSATVIAPLAGVVTYIFKRRRRFKFAELGVLLDKMKQSGATSEDGLHLMDAMHQARKVVKKRKLDSAFEYGVLAFIVVGLFGQNAGVGLLAGVIVYLYFRHEALKEYEKEEKRYQDSKRELLESL
jgi:hypothetical protein